MFTTCFFQTNQLFNLRSIYILNNKKMYFKYVKKYNSSQMIVTTAIFYQIHFS